MNGFTERTVTRNLAELHDEIKQWGALRLFAMIQGDGRLFLRAFRGLREARAQELRWRKALAGMRTWEPAASPPAPRSFDAS